MQPLKKSPVFKDYHILELENIINNEINELLESGYSKGDAFKQTIAKYDPVKKWAKKCTENINQSK